MLYANTSFEQAVCRRRLYTHIVTHSARGWHPCDNPIVYDRFESIEQTDVLYRSVALWLINIGMEVAWGQTTPRFAHQNILLVWNCSRSQSIS